MKSILKYCIPIVFLLFSCASGEKKQQKELSGPHGEILLMNSQPTSIDEKENYKKLEFYGGEESVEINKRNIALFQTDTLLQLVSKEAGLKYDADEIRDLLKFSTPEKTDLLKIEFYHNNENEAKSFLKILVTRMEENLMEEERNVVRRKINKLEEILDSLKVKLEESEMDLEERNILNLDDNSDPYGAESEAYFEAYVKVSQQKRNLLELQKIMANGTDEKLAAYISAFSEEDEFLNKALNDKYKMQLEINKLQCPTATSVECKNLRKNLAILDEDISMYLKNSLTALEYKEKEFQTVIKKLPKKARDVEQSKKEQLVNEQLYQHLMEKRVELQIGMAGIIGTILIVEGPVWKVK